MSKVFKAGYAKANITPPMGIDVRGYFKVRKADGVLDELETVALALSLDDKKVLLISIDNCSAPNDFVDLARTKINEKTVWQDLTEGLQIHEPATSKLFETGEWRTSTPILDEDKFPRKIKQTVF